MTENPRKPRQHKGLVIVNTGNGKGKTTAAIGLGIRAAGNGMKVLIVQFIKGRWKSGEREALKHVPGVDVYVMGLGFTIDRLRDERVSDEEHQAAATEAFTFARERLISGDYPMVILDEILGSINAGLVTLEDVLQLIQEKPTMSHLVLTGRNAPEALIDAADLVTEMREVKHPYKQGITAQRGIEF
ncbi:MAG: cob(I)yrinic acid a,c-diamide adenosyltransferase [Chloroflexota bacterium]